jgi:hypothetical protein
MAKRRRKSRPGLKPISGTFYLGDQAIPLTNVKVAGEALKLEFDGSVPSCVPDGPVTIEIACEFKPTPFQAAYLIPGKAARN